MITIVVLCSGNGSNLQALIDAAALQTMAYKIAAVIVNVPTSHAYTRALTHNIPAHIIDHTCFSSRALFEVALAEKIDSVKPDLIVLAGFMRVLTANFVARYQGKIINIHPSLLPAYKGLNTHQRVLLTGDKQHGCTVHYVNAQLDDGHIIAQAVCDVPENISITALKEKIHALEHALLPQTIAALAKQLTT